MNRLGILTQTILLQVLVRNNMLLKKENLIHSGFPFEEPKQKKLRTKGRPAKKRRPRSLCDADKQYGL